MKKHQTFDTRKSLRLNADHLGVDDLGLAGVSEIAGNVIESVVEEDVTSPTGQKKRMTVVYFKGKKKGLPCNVTNTRRIAQIAGGSFKSDDWLGKSITLQIEQGKLFGGQRGDVLRVKPVMRGDR